MENNVSMVILAIVLVLLIVILPVYNIFTRQDDISYTLALKAVTNFADKVRSTGILTMDDYNDFLSQLSSTNNSYSVEIEAHKRYYIKQEDGSYKGETLAEYTDKILDKLKNDNQYDGVYNLERGERFYVRIKNTNITLADSLLSSIKLFDSDSRIDIDYGGVVLVNSVKK